MKLRVGIAQLDIKTGDREANFRAVSEWLGKNITPSQKETAVVLPELWDTGYVIEQALKYGDRDAEKATAFLGRLARQ